MQKLSIPWGIPPRWNIIELCVEVTGNRSYLEIGCDRDDVFSRIQAQHKVGVDPLQGGTHRMTSDEFFAGTHDQFDVIYVDGLHHYDQASRDIENSLRCLSSDGFLIIHDMLPDHEPQTRVPRPDDWGGSWTGDVWRCGFDLMRREDLVFFICTIDCGVGVVFRGHQQPRGISVENSWRWYSENYHHLPLLDLTQAHHTIKTRV